MRFGARRVRQLAGVATVVAGLLSTLGVTASAVTPSSWTVDVTPTPVGAWHAVGFFNGHWFAFGDDDFIATSTNGTSWSERSVPAGPWQALAEGGGRVVVLARGGGGPYELTSTNGTTWSSVSGPAGDWTAVAYGDGRFVAVNAGGAIDTSTNGLTWTTTFSRRADSFTGVAYGNGRFMAVDGAQGDYLESATGYQWAFYTTPMAGLTWGGLTYGNGNFVAVTNSGAGVVGTSVLGYVWALHPVAPDQDLDAVAFGCNSFVALGTPTNGVNDLYGSATGASWSDQPVPTGASAPWTAAAFGGHHIVAVDAAGDIATAPSLADCGPTIPDAPQQVSGNIETHQIWTYMHPPPGPGGATVNLYRVNVTQGAMTWRCTAPVYFEPNCIVKHLQNRQDYVVTTQCHNRFGWSVATDPIVVVPVGSWHFSVVSAVPVVAAGSPVPVQVTGVQANSEGIYPVATITDEIGDQVRTCRPSPFGECLLSVRVAAGWTALHASYSGYGTYYSSATTHVAVATVDALPGSGTTNQRVDVTVVGGIGGSVARVAIGGRSFTTTLSRTGGGIVAVTLPATAGTYNAVYNDDGVNLETQSVTVSS